MLRLGLRSWRDLLVMFADRTCWYEALFLDL